MYLWQTQRTIYRKKIEFESAKCKEDVQSLYYILAPEAVLFCGYIFGFLISPKVEILDIIDFICSSKFCTFVLVAFMLIYLNLFVILVIHL